MLINVAFALLLPAVCVAGPTETIYHDAVVIGAGMAGAAVAHELYEHGIDYAWLEGRSEMGGRMRRSEQPIGGTPESPGWYVEEGANWSGGTKGNPVFEMIRDFGVQNEMLNYNKFTFLEEFIDDSGDHAIKQIRNNVIPWGPIEDAVQCVVDLALGPEEDRPHVDESLRDVLADRCDWPEPEPAPAGGVERFMEYYYVGAGYTMLPDRLSWTGLPDFALGYDFLEKWYFITNGKRGYKQVAEDYTMSIDQPRYNTKVTSVVYSGEGLSQSDIDDGYRAVVHTVDTETGKELVIKTKKVASTVSVGVLANQPHLFSPAPEYKLSEMNRIFQMGVLMKIFFAFEEKFWRNNEEFLFMATLEANGCKDWMSLDNPKAGYFEGSKILMCILITEDVEVLGQNLGPAQVDSLLDTLRLHYGELPGYSYHFKDWFSDEWTYGSYENAIPGFDQAGFDAFVAPITDDSGTNVVHMAGSATCLRHYGYIHGAYFSGIRAGLNIVNELTGFSLDTTSICDTAPPTGYGHLKPFRGQKRRHRA